MTAQRFNSTIWLHAPENGKNNRFIQTVSDQLYAANIHSSLDEPKDTSSVVIILLGQIDETQKETECLTELLSNGYHVIVIFTDEKPLPFFMAWQWLTLGVQEIIHWRDEAKIGSIVSSRLNRWSIIDRIMKSDRVRAKLVGSSPVWKKTVWQAVEMACFSTAPVLILGESGTGKELIARLIHDLDKRPDKQDLVLLDCTTIVPELSGSEFFGHEKGSFTNAVSSRDGAFSLANRGSLFLDELGELPMPLQAALLRVIQEGTYKRVGSNIWKKTSFRLISATNRDLKKEMGAGRFRPDLFYRISTCILRLPSLSERQLDILELAEHFLKEALRSETPPAFDRHVQHYLLSRDFPGNVRQLRQLIQRIAYKYTGQGSITIGNLTAADWEQFDFTEHSWQKNGLTDAIRQALANEVGFKDIKRIAGEVAMAQAIETADGNLQEAARRLGVSARLVQGWWAERRG